MFEDDRQIAMAGGPEAGVLMTMFAVNTFTGFRDARRGDRLPYTAAIAANDPMKLAAAFQPSAIMYCTDGATVPFSQNEAAHAHQPSARQPDFHSG